MLLFLITQDLPSKGLHPAPARRSRKSHHMPTITNPQLTPEMWKKLDKLIAKSLAQGRGSAYSMKSARTEGLSNAEQRLPSTNRSIAKDGLSMQQRGRYLIQFYISSSYYLLDNYFHQDHCGASLVIWRPLHFATPA